LEDSINLAVAYNIKSNLLKQMKDGDEVADEAIEITVEEPIVRITLTDKVLFKSGSYWVDKKAYNLLARIAEVINSEPNMDIRVEGHADNMKIADSSYIVDNWDLSIRRAASVVRTLEDKFEVGGDRLIASGRAHYYPVGDNATKEGRAKNRRTTILLLPKVDRYMEILKK
jgi:chemotaxis protein MotB